MAELDERYYQVPSSGVSPERAVRVRWSKVVVALVGGPLLVALSIMVVSRSNSMPELVSLFGVTLMPRGTLARHAKPAVHVAHKPILRPPVIPRRQIVRPMAAKEDDGMSMLDALCEVDTGEGCGTDNKAEAAIEVDLSGGDGKQIVDAVFELSAPENTLQQIGTSLPLGLVMEQNEEGKIVVVGADETGNGYYDGVRIGDIVRATSCLKQKKNADFTYWVGGVGSSGKKKALFTVDGASFSKAMAEIRSNADSDNTVVLVIERPAVEDEVRDFLETS